MGIFFKKERIVFPNRNKKQTNYFDTLACTGVSADMASFLYSRGVRLWNRLKVPEKLLGLSKPQDTAISEILHSGQYKSISAPRMIRYFNRYWMGESCMVF